MEKLIDQTPYNTADFAKIASWSSSEVSETLYFADNGNYLLYCVGNDATMTNVYGTETYTNEDLIILPEEDVYGWLKVHAEEVFEELFGDENIVLLSA